MRLPLVVIALCLSLLASGCGGDDDATSAQDTGSATTTQSQDATTDGEKSTEPVFESEDERFRKKFVVGDYEEEPPFSAVQGSKGNERPSFDPLDQPEPKKLYTRELEVGSGPAVQKGDEVRVYYAGAIYGTSRAKYYGWLPSFPAIVRLGSGLWGDGFEEGIVGMRVGGLRQVLIPSSLLEGTDPPPLEYVIKLVALKQK
jgi:FKBP-type peptidyl-prolyl cis-trans isomerase